MQLRINQGQNWKTKKWEFQFKFFSESIVFNKQDAHVLFWKLTQKKKDSFCENRFRSVRWTNKDKHTLYPKCLVTEVSKTEFAFFNLTFFGQHFCFELTDQKYVFQKALQRENKNNLDN